MSLPDNYFENVPEWDSHNPTASFEIKADAISGRIPVTRLEHWKDFAGLLENPFFNQTDTQFIFRGHRRYDWGMTPSLARITQDGIVTQELRDQQLGLFRKAIRGRIEDHSLLEDGPEDDELWSIGQHHGLMTPLLDWTYSPYVALFFAFAKEDQTDEKDNPYRAVYIINKTFIEDDDLCPDIRVFEPKKDDHGRLVNQAGLFTFSPLDATIENKLAEVLSADEFKESELKEAAEEDQAGILAKYICKIYIRNEDQPECLKHLRRMNVHHASLFPDLIGAADYCNIFMGEMARERALEAPLPSTESAPTSATDISEQTSDVDLGRATTIIGLLQTQPESQTVEPGRLQLIANELDKHLSKSMVVDWDTRDNVKAEMKSTTRVLLRKYAYPINARKEVEDNIVEVLVKGTDS